MGLWRSPRCWSSYCIGGCTRYHWQVLIEGVLPQQWVSYQDTYYQSTGKLSNGKRWATQLILKLLNIAWDLWEHRNGIVHTKDQNQLLQSVNSEIANVIHNGPPSVDATHLFTELAVRNLETAQLPTKQAWLALVASYQRMETNARKTYRGLQGMQRIMQQFVNSTQNN